MYINVYEQTHLGLACMALGYKYAHFARPTTTAQVKENKLKDFALAVSTRIPHAWGYTKAHADLLSMHINLLAKHEEQIIMYTNTPPTNSPTVQLLDAKATSVECRSRPDLGPTQQGLFASKKIGVKSDLRLSYPGGMVLDGAALREKHPYTHVLPGMKGNAVHFDGVYNCTARRINDIRGTDKDANVGFLPETSEDGAFCLKIGLLKNIAKVPCAHLSLKE
jgi:hypothetical protein